jgi:hypothetical protein
VKKANLINRSENEDGLVYFIGNDWEGPVKIGFTSQPDPNIRLRQLQTASHCDLSVLGVVSGTIAKEQAIHAFLSYDNVRGEWFKRESALAMLQHLSVYDQSRVCKNKFFDNLWNIAIGIGEGELTTEEFLQGDDEPLASTTARHILLDMLRTFHQCHAEKPLPLLTWLINQEDRDDAIGDLAKDACNDYNFPRVGSVSDYVNYIVNESIYPTGSAVTRAVIDAWIECQQAILSLK